MLQPFGICFLCLQAYMKKSDLLKVTAKRAKDEKEKRSAAAKAAVSETDVAEGDATEDSLQKWVL